MINVTVAVVTYNSQEYIGYCVNSIKEKTKDINYEIIICDNNSKDKTVEYIENNLCRSIKNIKLIKNSINYGYTKAANQIASIATGEYIFFLNPDTILKNNAISILYQTAIKSDAALLGGKLLNNDNKYIFSFGYLPNLDELILLYTNNVNKITKRYMNKNEQQTAQMIIGTDFFVNRKIFEELGKFDEDYFMYYEDLDFCYRLNERKYKILYEPKAEISHFIGKSAENTEKTYLYNLCSMYKYAQKNLFSNATFIQKIKFKILYWFLLKKIITKVI